MSTNDQKKPLNWIKLAQFIIFSISCLSGVMKEVEIINLELREFKNNFSAQIDKMESSNDSILELITDIRLTLAERKND